MFVIIIFVIKQSCDMNDEMRSEAVETCVTACEKYSSNNEVIIPV